MRLWKNKKSGATWARFAVSWLAYPTDRSTALGGPGDLKHVWLENSVGNEIKHENRKQD
jgi:hypothetical protein